MQRPSTGNSLPSIDDPLARPKRSTVVLAVAVTGLLAVSIFALLLYRAYTIQEPTRVLIVRADSSWDGVELSVEGNPLPEPRITHIEKLGNYVVPFFLWPGKYTLRVKSEDHELLSRHFDLSSTQVDEIDLTRIMTGPATQPSTAPS